MRRTEQEIIDFNKKILEVCDFLIEQKLERSYLKITQKTGMNLNYIRDLRKNKSRYSEKFLNNLCDIYPINKDYILTGKGDILSHNNINPSTKGDGNIVTNNSINILSHSNIKTQEELIKSQEEEIKFLKNEIEFFKRQNKELLEMLVKTNK